MFTGELVRLRALQETDLEHVEAMEADAATLRLRRDGPVYPGGKAEVAAFWERNRTESPTRFGFAIEALEDGRFVGRCAVRDVMRNHRSAEFGIALMPGEEGRHYGTDALDIMLRFALGSLALNRVWATIRADNERSLALFDHAGFVREARFREEALDVDGNRVDVFSVSLLRREWRATR